MLKYIKNKNFPIEGIEFIDFTPTITDYKCFNHTINSLKKLVDTEVDYIIAPDARGFIWASALALKLKVPMIPLRKEGKLPKENVSYTVNYKTEYSNTTLEIPNIDLKNKKCLFVDDVYATGGTYYASEELVKKSGGIMVGGIVLYNVLIDDNKNIKCLINRNNI